MAGGARGCRFDGSGCAAEEAGSTQGWLQAWEPANSIFLISAGFLARDSLCQRMTQHSPARCTRDGKGCVARIETTVARTRIDVRRITALSMARRELEQKPFLFAIGLCGSRGLDGPGKMRQCQSSCKCLRADTITKAANSSGEVAEWLKAAVC